MSKVAIIDYGMGNLHSVSKAVEHVAPGMQVVVSADADEIRQADRVIFPGVGAIRDCMAEIKRLKFDRLVTELAQDRPVLGICVGMQALMTRSDENGGVAGINLIPGHVSRFDTPLLDAAGQRLKVPHMGWNAVNQVIDHPLWQGIADAERFYFVHSYYVDVAGNSAVTGTCDYGVKVAAAVAQGNVFAVQFHPEKSQHAGLTLLKNFTQWSI